MLNSLNSHSKSSPAICVRSVHQWAMLFTRLFTRLLVAVLSCSVIWLLRKNFSKIELLQDRTSLSQNFSKRSVPDRAAHHHAHEMASLWTVKWTVLTFAVRQTVRSHRVPQWTATANSLHVTVATRTFRNRFFLKNLAGDSLRRDQWDSSKSLFNSKFQRWDLAVCRQSFK